MRPEILRLEKVTTAENGVIHLDNFNLHLFSGEIMGLIPINQQGLNSLIELICKNTPLYYGFVYFNERLVNSYARSRLARNKVSVIEKQLKLIENLTVADNIYVMRHGFKKYLIDSKTLNSQFARFVEEVGIDLRGEQQVQGLTYYEKCLVELLKAIIAGSKLIIIRDLSNLISSTDLLRFHKLMRKYTGQGVSFLYICSHHQEAFAICDRLCLMENGKALKVLGKDEFKEEKILPFTNEFYRNYHKRQALPEWLNDFPWAYQSKTPVPGEGFAIERSSKAAQDQQPVLEFNNVSMGAIKNLSFSIKPGECVVLLDKNNTVYSDILALLSWAAKPQTGVILLNGAPLTKKALQSIGFIPEKPVQNLLFKEMSFLDNLCFTADNKLNSFWMRTGVRKSIIKEYGRIIGPDITAQDITKLSDQSLYNLVYYRIHFQNPRLAVCVNPFFEGDMAIRLQILNLIKVLLGKEITVLILAVNLSDFLLIADRLLVLENGALIEELWSRASQHLARDLQ